MNLSHEFSSVVTIYAMSCLTLLMVTLCEGHIAFLLCLTVWWIGILLTMFGTNLFPLRCLFLCGISFVIDYQQKTTCWRSIIPSSDIMCVADCGTSETATHLFLGCRISISVWYHVLNWL